MIIKEATKQELKLTIHGLNQLLQFYSHDKNREGAKAVQKLIFTFSLHLQAILEHEKNEEDRTRLRIVK